MSAFRTNPYPNEKGAPPEDEAPFPRRDDRIVQGGKPSNKPGSILPVARLSIVKSRIPVAVLVELANSHRFGGLVGIGLGCGSQRS